MHSDLFHPEKILAAGPSAKIYRGVETATGRKVLIKALLEDHEASHPLDRERLQLLAHSLLHVRHPQIAGLITLLPTEEEFALVYEFVPGISGRALPTEKRLSAADVRALAVQLLHAMAVGEHLRLPHGDLKPSNLIIADHPGGGLFLQVQDWGIAMARVHPSPETMWFAAPERLHGAPPSTQSDLFTAAASLFYLATGTAPAQGSTPEEILTDWASFDVRGSLAVVRPDIDQPLVDWLGWLLQRDPAHRPHTVGHALDMLMRSMHTGFIYQPAPAPQMAPGAATGPLVAGGAPNAAMPRAPAPRPPQQAAAPTGAIAKPAPKPSPPKGAVAKPQPTGPISKPQSTGTLTKPLQAGPKLPGSGSVTGTLRPAATQPNETAAIVNEAPPAPKKPKISTKAIVAIALNVAALAFVLWFFQPFANSGTSESEEDAETGTAPASSPAASPAVKSKSKAAAAAVEGPGLKGRQVWVGMKGKAILNLAEVQVFSGTNNIADQGEATQTSVEWNGYPDRAIDGNTDGDFEHKSVTHTHGGDSDPQWKLKFPKDVTLNTIVVWNRTGAEFKGRLKDFTVSVRDAKDKVLWEKTVKESPAPQVKLVVGK